MLERRHRSARPLSLGVVVSCLRRGAGDPTSHHERGSGTWWFAWHTPEGPVTLRLSQARAEDEVAAAVWGAGGEWALDGLEALLGEGDDASGFVAHHPLVAELARRFPGWRVTRTRLVTQAIVPSIIEQKVTGKQAFAAYRMLVRRFGEPAPGPGGALRLVAPPDAATWARIPSWEWLQAGVDGARSRAAVTAAGRASRLEQCVDLPVAQARSRMESLPGVGRWTSAEVAQRALGDADAVSFGDYHVAKDIGWALTGSAVDDDGLAELLEPYAGHRFRVQRLIELGGIRRPRRGARMSVPGHLPTRPG